MKLMEILMSKEPSYVRCIKPNDAKQPGTLLGTELALLYITVLLYYYQIKAVFWNNVQVSNKNIFKQKRTDSK